MMMSSHTCQTHLPRADGEDKSKTTRRRVCDSAVHLHGYGWALGPFTLAPSLTEPQGEFGISFEAKRLESL
jgi:hypothetical protein